MQKISLVFLNFKLQFFSSSLPFVFFFIHVRDFTNQPITSKSFNLDIGKLTWTFFAYFQFCFRGVLDFFSFCSRKFVAPLFGIYRSFGVFVLAKYCGSFSKFNTYFLRSWTRVSFRKWIFLQPRCLGWGFTFPVFPTCWFLEVFVSGFGAFSLLQS